MRYMGNQRGVSWGWQTGWLLKWDLQGRISCGRDTIYCSEKSWHIGHLDWPTVQIGAWLLTSCMSIGKSCDLWGSISSHVISSSFSEYIKPLAWHRVGPQHITFIIICTSGIFPFVNSYFYKDGMYFW